MNTIQETILRVLADGDEKPCLQLVSESLQTPNRLFRTTVYVWLTVLIDKQMITARKLPPDAKTGVVRNAYRITETGREALPWVI